MSPAMAAFLVRKFGEFVISELREKADRQGFDGAKKRLDDAMTELRTKGETTLEHKVRNQFLIVNAAGLTLRSSEHDVVYSWDKVKGPFEMVRNPNERAVVGFPTRVTNLNFGTRKFWANTKDEQVNVHVKLPSSYSLGWDFLIILLNEARQKFQKAR